MSALREAVATVEEKIDAECQDAPAPCFEENDYEAGYIAGLAFAQDLLRELLKAHPAIASEYEWGTGGPHGYVNQEDTERDARVDVKLSNRVLFKRIAPGPWERAE